MSTVVDAPRSSLVAPRILRVPLADARWIEIREQLNHGEYTALYHALYEERDGEYVRNPLRWNDQIVIAYLVDWNLVDDEGRVLPIRGRSREEIGATLNHIDEDEFVEIKEAVEAHANAQARARLEKKRLRTIAVGL